MSEPRLKDIPKKYDVDDPRKQWIKAYEERAAREGAAEIRAYNWRKAFFASMFVTTLCVGVTGYMATQSSIIPYIVHVDNQTGAVLNVNKVTANTEINEMEIRYFLWNILRKVRTVPKDLVLYDTNWKEAYKFLDSTTSKKMNNTAIEENHKKRLETGQTTSIDLKSFNKVAGQNATYQIRWVESNFDTDGKILSKVNMSGFFSIGFKNATAETIMINPLGIVVKDFNMAKES